MFVKVKGVLLQNDWSYARVGKKYDEWLSSQVCCMRPKTLIRAVSPKGHAAFQSSNSCLPVAPAEVSKPPQDAQGHSDIVSNLWKTNPLPLKAPRIAYMRARGSQCFDVEYYRSHNKDLTHISDALQLWEHFVTLGEFEGRPFRFTCENQIA